jgi:Tol biopolymer transport system component
MRRLLAPLCLVVASCLVSFGPAAPPASAAAGRVERLSDGPNGLQGNDYSYSPAVSADGRYVAFESFADNLDPVTPPSTASMDVFVRDRVTGVTRQASVDSSGNPGDSYSANADISEDGRYVVFDSYSRMDPRHTNPGHNVYRRDLVTRTTEIVSVNDAGQDSNTGYYANMGYPQVSANGRFVAWSDEATNLVPNDTNGNDWAGVMKGYDCFLRDMEAGTTIRASVTSTGGQVDGPEYGKVGQSWCTAISPSGRYVSFQSYDQVVPEAPYGATRGYVFDRLTGTSLWPFHGTNVHVVSFSADDTKWLLQGPANQLVPGDTSSVIVHAVLDRVTGLVRPVQRSALTGGAPNGSSYSGDISADGTRVSFSSSAYDLVLPDVNQSADVFVVDLRTGTTTLVSEGIAAVDAALGADSLEPTISGDGTYVAWYGYSTTQVVPDANFATDVFGRRL